MFISFNRAYESAGWSVDRMICSFVRLLVCWFIRYMLMRTAWLFLIVVSPVRFGVIQLSREFIVICFFYSTYHLPLVTFLSANQQMCVQCVFLRAKLLFSFFSYTCKLNEIREQKPNMTRTHRHKHNPQPRQAGKHIVWTRARDREKQRERDRGNIEQERTNKRHKETNAYIHA